MSGDKYAYVIQCQAPGMPVKIGCARDVSARLQGFRTHNPFPFTLNAVIGGGSITEREMKQLFKEHRISGEWFAPTQALNDYLAGKRVMGQLFRQVAVTREYVAERLIPLLRQHLGGRDPGNWPSGDVAFRLLHNAIPNVPARAKEIVESSNDLITLDLARGFVCDTSDAAFTPVVIPETNVVPLARGSAS